ncbi:hypothetical protein BDR03DRAFT_966361 [Suillus americanus]|nr:hypothetical protein BDR03DRAFT_966361 [Suillus americanus]
MALHKNLLVFIAGHSNADITDPSEFQVHQGVYRPQFQASRKDSDNEELHIITCLIQAFVVGSCIIANGNA